MIAAFPFCNEIDSLLYKMLVSRASPVEHEIRLPAWIVEKFFRLIIPNTSHFTSPRSGNVIATQTRFSVLFAAARSAAVPVLTAVSPTYDAANVSATDGLCQTRVGAVKYWKNWMFTLVLNEGFSLPCLVQLGLKVMPDEASLRHEFRVSTGRNR